MKIEQLLLDFFSKTKIKIHKKRANILAKMAVSAITNPKAIYLTNLGRNLNILNSTHKCKSQKEIDKIRNSVNRQAPLGHENWLAKTAKKYGFLSTLNAREIPKNEKK